MESDDFRIRYTTTGGNSRETGQPLNYSIGQFVANNFLENGLAYEELKRAK